MKLLTVLLSLFSAASVFAQTPPVIDASQAPAPLYDDPITHGATDPFVIWNPGKSEWFMYYTQRRSTLDNPKGVDWVHGSAIGIATSPDGIHWSYLGLCKGDHDLSDPLAAQGAGPEPGITWWAPCFLRIGDTFHMWIVRVDGVYTNWTGKRNILHFTSDDGIDWKYASTCSLASDRVIDPTVYCVGDLWYMVYKNEAAGSHTFVSQSADLENWTNAHQAEPDGGQEAPFTFRWCDKWWLIVDAGRSMRLYTSENGIDHYQYVTSILDRRDGVRDKDNAVGHHPGVVIQWAQPTRMPDLLFYGVQPACLYATGRTGNERGRNGLLQSQQVRVGGRKMKKADRSEETSKFQGPTSKEDPNPNEIRRRKDFESKKAVQSISLMNKLNQSMSMKTTTFKRFAVIFFFAIAIARLGAQTNTQVDLTNSIATNTPITTAAENDSMPGWVSTHFNNVLSPPTLVMLIPIIAIVMGCSIPIIIVGLSLYFQHRKNLMLHETVRAMVDKGVPIPPEMFQKKEREVEERDKPGDKHPHKDMRNGLILTGVGIGVVIICGRPGWIILFLGVAEALHLSRRRKIFNMAVRNRLQ